MNRSFQASLYFATILAMSSAGAGAGEFDGVRMPESAIVAGQTLVLNGMGTRTRFGLIKIYVAGLYLSTKSTDGAAVLAQTGAKRIEFQLKRTVEAQIFAKALDEGVKERASAEQLAALKDRLDKFHATILALDEVKVGDVVDLDYAPASGTQVVVNGKPTGAAIGGDDFFKAILDLFVGAKPVQDTLKLALLGGAR